MSTSSVFNIVSMRPQEPQKGLGRSKTLYALYRGLYSIGCRPAWLRLTPGKFRLMGLALASVRWVGSLLVGRPLPLQSLIALQCVFPKEASASDNRAIVYIDGVRLAYLVPDLRLAIGGRIIVDFDDLMSRRVARMRRAGSELSFGAFASMLPPFAASAIRAAAPLHRWLYGVEKRLLRASEIRAAEEADAIAFTSPFEARLFSRLLRRYRPELRPQYLVLGPSVGEPLVAADADAVGRASPDIRFIFVGSDILEQNRIAIAGIRDLAAKGRLAAPVHIYGKMTQAYEDIPGVCFEGYIEDVADAYAPGAILLIPKSTRGGIKSKILEAFEHGTPTIATPSAVEGFDPTYPWRLDDERLGQLVGDLKALRAGYAAAVAAGSEICRRQFSADRYWSELRGYVEAPGRRLSPSEDFDLTESSAVSAALAS